MSCADKRFCDEKALSSCCGVVLLKSVLQLYNFLSGFQQNEEVEMQIRIMTLIKT